MRAKIHFATLQLPGGGTECHIKSLCERSLVELSERLVVYAVDSILWEVLGLAWSRSFVKPFEKLRVDTDIW